MAWEIGAILLGILFGKYISDEIDLADQDDDRASALRQTSSVKTPIVYGTQFVKGQITHSSNDTEDSGGVNTVVRLSEAPEDNSLFQIEKVFFDTFEAEDHPFDVDNINFEFIRWAFRVRENNLTLDDYNDVNLMFFQNGLKGFTWQELVDIHIGNINFGFTDFLNSPNTQMSGLCGFFVRGKNNPEKSVSAFPNITVKLKGGITTPAQAIQDFLFSTRYGCGNEISEELVNLDDGMWSLAQAHNYANENVTLRNPVTNTTSTVKRYTVNYVCDFSLNKWETLSEIARSMSAFIRFSQLSGKIEVVYDRARTSVATYDDDDFIDILKLTKKPSKDSPTKLDVNYPSATDEYKGQTDSFSLDLNDNRTLDITEDLTLKATGSYHSAYIIARIRLAKSSLRNIFTFKLDHRGLGLESGDVLTISSEYSSISTTLVEVIQIDTEFKTDGKIELTITAVEYSASVYSISEILDTIAPIGTQVLSNPRVIANIVPPTPSITNIFSTNNPPTFDLTQTMSLTFSARFIDVYYAFSEINGDEPPIASYTFLHTISNETGAYAFGASITSTIYNLKNAETNQTIWIRTRLRNESYSTQYSASTFFLWTIGTAVVDVFTSSGTWTKREGFSNALVEVWGGGGAGGTRLESISFDAITPLTGTDPTQDGLRRIAYGLGWYVKCNYNNNIAVSQDGRNWSVVSFDTDEVIANARVLKDRWVILSTTGFFYTDSTDLTDTTAYTKNTNASGTGLMFFVTQSDGTEIYYIDGKYANSLESTNWTDLDVGTPDDNAVTKTFNHVAVGRHSVLLHGSGFEDNKIRACQIDNITDADEWFTPNIIFPSNYFIQDIDYYDGIFVCLAINDPNFGTSRLFYIVAEYLEDHLTWQTATNPPVGANYGAVNEIVQHDGLWLVHYALGFFVRADSLTGTWTAVDMGVGFVSEPDTQVLNGALFFTKHRSDEIWTSIEAPSSVIGVNWRVQSLSNATSNIAILSDYEAVGYTHDSRQHHLLTGVLTTIATNPDQFLGYYSERRNNVALYNTASPENNPNNYVLEALVTRQGNAFLIGDYISGFNLRHPTEVPSSGAGYHYQFVFINKVNGFFFVGAYRIQELETRDSPVSFKVWKFKSVIQNVGNPASITDIFASRVAGIQFHEADEVYSYTITNDSLFEQSFTPIAHEDFSNIHSKSATNIEFVFFGGGSGSNRIMIHATSTDNGESFSNNTIDLSGSQGGMAFVHTSVQESSSTIVYLTTTGIFNSTGNGAFTKQFGGTNSFETFYSMKRMLGKNYLVGSTGIYEGNVGNIGSWTKRLTRTFLRDVTHHVGRTAFYSAGSLPSYYVSKNETTNNNGGGGGSGGGYRRALLRTEDMPDTVSVIIGAGGDVRGTTGANGGSSMFDNLASAGGTGGQFTSSTSATGGASSFGGDLLTDETSIPQFESGAGGDGVTAEDGQSVSFAGGGGAGGGESGGKSSLSFTHNGQRLLNGADDDDYITKNGGGGKGQSPNKLATKGGDGLVRVTQF